MVAIGVERVSQAPLTMATTMGYNDLDVAYPVAIRTVPPMPEPSRPAPSDDNRTARMVASEGIYRDTPWIGLLVVALLVYVVVAIVGLARRHGLGAAGTIDSSVADNVWVGVSVAIVSSFSWMLLWFVAVIDRRRPG